MMKKYISAILGLTLAVAMFVPVAKTQASGLTIAQIDSIVSLLESFGADAVTIANVRASLTGEPTTAVETVSGYTFSANMEMGDNSADVLNLQKVLNSDVATQVATTGVGSKGNETTYFGSLTKQAVIKFQNKYASEVLAPVGLTSGTGYVGVSTRAKLNSLSMDSEEPVVEDSEPAVEETVIENDIVLLGDSVVSKAVPNNAINVEFLRFKTNTFVDDLTFAHRGLGDKNELTYLTIYVDGFLVATKTENSFGSDMTAKFRNLNISEGSVVSVRADMDGSAGNQHYVELVETYPLVDNLPVSGNVMTVAGSLLNEAELTSYSISDNSVVAGENNVKLADFRVRVPADNSSDTTIKSIQLENKGDADVSNLKLVVDGRTFNAIVNSDDDILFDGINITIEERRSETFRIYGDTDEDESATSTIKLSITALDAVDVNGFNVNVSGELDNIIEVTTDGSIKVSEDKDLEKSTYLVGDKNKTILSFNIEPDGEDFDVETVEVSGLSTTTTEKISLYHGSTLIAKEDVFDENVSFEVNYRIYEDSNFVVKADFYDIEDIEGTTTVQFTPSLESVSVLGVRTDKTSILGKVEGELVTVYTSYPEITKSDNFNGVIFPPTEMETFELNVKAIGGDIRLSTTTPVFTFDMSMSGMPSTLTYNVYVDGKKNTESSTATTTDSMIVILDKEVVIEEGDTATFLFEFDFAGASKDRSFRMTLTDVIWESMDDEDEYQEVRVNSDVIDLPIKSAYFYNEN